MNDTNAKTTEAATTELKQQGGAMNDFFSAFYEFPTITRLGLIVIAIGWLIAAVGLVWDFYS